MADCKETNAWDPGCSTTGDSSGGASGDYVPLAGTADGAPITGTLVLKNTFTGEQWSIDVPLGSTNAMVLAAITGGASGGNIVISTKDGTTPQLFVFNKNGQLVLPTGIDYSTAVADAVVSKQFVEDSIASGGNPNTYVPLAGTAAGVPITGDLVFEDAANSLEYVIGPVDAFGVRGYSIGATGNSGAPSPVLCVTDTTIHAFIDKRLVSPEINIYDDVNDTAAAKSYRFFVDTLLGVNTAILYPTAATSGFSFSALDVDGTTLSTLLGTADGGLEWNGAKGFAADKAILGGGTEQAGFEVTVNGSQYVDGLLSVAGAGASVLTNWVDCQYVNLTVDPGAPGHAARRSWIESTFVDKSTQQTVGGLKTYTSYANFTGNNAGVSLETTNSIVTNSNILIPNIPTTAGSDVGYYLGGLCILSCDMRIKENIVDLEYGLLEVLQADVIRYDLRDEYRTEGAPSGDVGFNAQQLSELIPEAAPYDAEKDLYGLSTKPLVATLFNAVKELAARVEELEAKLPG